MEVHRHQTATGSHSKRKKWTDHLWDFFMLFLAVFCGFLAEWKLEHIIEHQREKQFIHSLCEDLKRDTAQASRYIRFNENILNYCDSVQYLISHTDFFKNSNNLYNYTRELARFMRYHSTDRTMQQLKNAGNMRLIRKWDVSNAITEYDSKAKLLTELDQQLSTQIIKYRDYLIEFLDLTSYDMYNPVGSFMDNYSGTKGNPGFITRDMKKAKIIYNQVFTLKIFLATVQQSAKEIKIEGEKLLEILQKEYHFK
jgi:hypothetical protein